METNRICGMHLRSEKPGNPGLGRRTKNAMSHAFGHLTHLTICYVCRQRQSNKKHVKINKLGEMSVYDESKGVEVEEPCDRTAVGRRTSRKIWYCQ